MRTSPTVSRRRRNRWLGTIHQMLAQTVGTSRATSACSKLHDLPWLSSVQALQCKQNLTGLTPKSGLIAAQPIERIGWQVGQANKSVGEIVGLVSEQIGRWCASINASGEVSLIRP